MVWRVNFLLQEVLAVVERVEGDRAWVRDENGVEWTIANDRKLKVGDTVKLVLADGTVAKVLDT
jgi:membrane protein implicated in regulation of membrane protease activity